MQMGDTENGLRIRRNQAKLSPGEKKVFTDAVLALKQSPSQLYPPSNNKYDDYVVIHSTLMLMISTGPMSAHQGPAFLPWHREFIRRFEQDLQLIHLFGIMTSWEEPITLMIIR
jgi:tyrosinase